jgi:hypothetical protein
MSNLFGGLAGLGSQTQLQQSSQGIQGQAFAGGPSTAQQIAGLVGAARRF